MIDWFKTAKRENTQVSDRRVWRSRCDHYRVEESNIRYGGDLGYPTIYRSMVLKDFGWDVISYHRKRKTAIEACEYFHEHGHPKPPKTKKRRRKKRASKR